MSDRTHWRALIYNRASADAAGQEVSVESQDTENRAWCNREHWEIAGVITDNDRSATRFATKEREGFKAIGAGLADSRWGRVNVLVTWASSRNQRRLDGYVDLRELCVRHDLRLAYKGRVYDLTVGADRFTTGLDALLDERDAEEIRDGILRSHRASVAAGRPRGSIPYGYTRSYLPGLRRIGEQVPDPDTAPVVQGIVAEVLAGVPLYRIAQRLNRDEVITPQEVRDGRREREVDRNGWSSSMVRNLLRKPSLMGMRSHRGVIVGEGAWEPIVTPDDWRAVQALFADPRRAGNTRGREARWLLSGIATCGVCEAWLRPMLNRGRMMYVCAGKTPTSPKGHVARAQKPLDALVIFETLRRLEDPGLLAYLARSRTTDRSTLEEAQRELRVLTARRLELEETAGNGDISPGMAGRLEARLDADEATVRARLSALALPHPILAEAAGPDARARWNDHADDIAWQRNVVRAVVRVVVHRTTLPRGMRGFDRDSIEIANL